MISLATATAFIKESGMRKIGSCLSVFFTCAFLAMRGVLPAADFVTVTLVVLGAITGGNVMEHALNRKEKTPDAAPPAA